MGEAGRKMRITYVILIAMLALCLAACGKGTQTDRESGSKSEDGIEGGAEAVENADDISGKDEADGTSGDDTTAGGEQETDQPDHVIGAYITGNTKYTDEIMPVQYVDDLSHLTDLKYTNGTYVYQDGKVYYRRYYEDSYEEAALWGNYDAISGREKEMVCIDVDGTVTELFSDKGVGDIYLINDRFYMTDSGIGEVDEIGDTDTGNMLYSVDMQGNDRIDYGEGKICAVDTERKIFVIEPWENDLDYYILNYETGEKKFLFNNSGDCYIDISAYQDGWVYYEKRDDDFPVCKLCAVSIEGEQREIIAITPADISVTYGEIILDVEVDGDRIYFIFGGYSGSMSVFQGGILISVKLDGTDYKAVEVKEDTFYLSHDKGKALVYFPRYDSYFRADDGLGREKYEMFVWDVEADTCYLSDFPTNILNSYSGRTDPMWRYYPADKGALCPVMTSAAGYPGVGWGDKNKTDVYAIPDDSGKIVRVVTDIAKYTTKWEEKEAEWIIYEDFYFTDGFLYFKAEYSTYDAEASIGWRDGYRRLHTDIYRLKIGESKAKILYSY